MLSMTIARATVASPQFGDPLDGPYELGPGNNPLTPPTGPTPGGCITVIGS